MTCTKSVYISLSFHFANTNAILSFCQNIFIYLFFFFDSSLFMMIKIFDFFSLFQLDEFCVSYNRLTIETEYISFQLLLFDHGPCIIHID